MLRLEANNSETNYSTIRISGKEWMFLRAIPRTTIYAENNYCVPFNILPWNFPGRSEQNGEKNLV